MKYKIITIEAKKLESVDHAIADFTCWMNGFMAAGGNYSPGSTHVLQDFRTGELARGKDESSKADLLAGYCGLLYVAYSLQTDSETISEALALSRKTGREITTIFNQFAFLITPKMTYKQAVATYDEERIVKA